MDVAKIGSLIAAVRKEKGMTQKELAGRLNVSDRAVSKWERGLNLPDAALFEPLCRELGISVSELLRGERETPTVSEMEQVVTDVLSLAERREYTVKRNLAALQGLLFLVVYLALPIFLLWGGPLRVISEVRALFQEPSIYPPGVQMHIQSRYGEEEYSKSLYSYLDLQPGGAHLSDHVSSSLQEGPLWASYSPESEEIQSLYTVDVTGYDTLYFRLSGGFPEGEDFGFRVVCIPQKYLGTVDALKDLYRVHTYDPAPPRYNWPGDDYLTDVISVTPYPNYYYAVLVTWGDGYYVEYPFLTI